MADVFNEMEIAWKGKSYTFTPSNRVLRRIEGELAPSSLTDVIRRMTEGKPPISETAFIVAKFLEAGGAPADVADEDEVYSEIMQDFASNNGEGFIKLCETIMLAISPSDHVAKKQSAVGENTQPKATAKGKKKRASTSA